MFLDEDDLENSATFWPYSPCGSVLYMTVIFLFFCILLFTFLIHMDISLVARGVIRPMAEIAEIRSPKGGTIDSIFYHEGDSVLKDGVLIKFRDHRSQIRSPVSGNLLRQYINYAGSHIRAGELICTISPNGQLIGECYVTSKDIGLLKEEQTVKFQVDAYNYNFFGTGSGRIYFMDNDYILLDKNPVYRVRFQLNERMLKLSNGFSGELKKGMGFQARFKVCTRSLWQLLYEKINDWLNPVRQPV
jgi:multidrug efflux pump subunit AcrA (membrane-fusion protein)